jgi:alkyl sulfatase BDS1-like metallo-beta-lactamase superfamily hydrolase
VEFTLGEVEMLSINFVKCRNLCCFNFWIPAFAGMTWEILKKFIGDGVMKYGMGIVTGLISSAVIIAGCGGGDAVPVSASGELAKYCADVVGAPRVERISEHVWAAIGYDLASTVLVHTPQGNVIIDVSMSPARAREAKKALMAVAPNVPVKAIIYTHSHIDHIGGASEWAGPGTQIWATDAFVKHFFKQYGLFRRAETLRGRRQFASDVPDTEIPCSGLGRLADIKAALENGIRLPTHTFTGRKVLDFGGVKIEMREAHGETHDHLFVWVPGDKTLIPGDNFYWSFPNLYTIRGTSPRPVEEWIASLDEMRGLRPLHMIPIHTKAIHGEAAIEDALASYRDAIQWVRDEVVRRANRGDDVDSIAESVKLPEHLAKKPWLGEYYGQVSWSARAIYSNYLGWFDGRADKLYPMPAAEASKREVALMGGAAKVRAESERAEKAGDFRWAIHLLAKLRAAGEGGDIAQRLARCYRGLAATIPNTNGRGYLLQSAIEERDGVKEVKAPKIGGELAARVTLETIFSIMAVKLIPEKAMDVHESVRFEFPKENAAFTVTVRNGVAEVVPGRAIPGTPEPVAVITADGASYRRVAMKLESPVAALKSGGLRVRGSWIKFLAFMNRFDREP